MKVMEHIEVHAEACADAGRINMVFPNDPVSFEFWAERASLQIEKLGTAQVLQMGEVSSISHAHSVRFS